MQDPDENPKAPEQDVQYVTGIPQVKQLGSTVEQAAHDPADTPKPVAQAVHTAALVEHDIQLDGVHGIQDPEDTPNEPEQDVHVEAGEHVRQLDGMQVTHDVELRP